ncbi:hypothetical protein Tco_0558403 [Tanacetum coccineum]
MEVQKVQTVFNQMEAAVQQYFVDIQCFEIPKKELSLENDRLLHKIMSQDVMLCVMNSTTVFDDVNVELQSSESCVKCFDLDTELLNKQNAYNDLLKSYSQLEKHCISLELSIQLNQEIFQRDTSCDNQHALEILEYFENNDLKAQLQDKDTTIYKLKELIKSMRENNKEEKINHDISGLETINEEPESKQSDSLIAKLNLKSVENEDFKAQLQEKVFVITSLKIDLRKLKGKEILKNVAQIPTATTIVLGMFKLDLDHLAHRLIQNREAHIYYLKHTQEQADVLRGIELLIYVRDTCPNAIKLSEKKVVVTPMNKVKKVRFSEPLTSLSNIKQIESSKTSDSNTTVLSYIGLKCSTNMEDDVDISAFTMEQYIALILDDIKPGILNLKIGDNVEFEINANFMRELRRKLFTCTDDEDAYEHVRTVLKIVDLFHFLGVTHDAIILRKLEEIRNFKQERDETLYHAWKRYNDLLYQCPLHDLNCQQKVHIFYTRLDISTRKILDSNGFIPLMTPTQALESIQVMADHSHDWYNETTNGKRINDIMDNVDAIHEREKVKAITTMGKENMKELVLHDLSPTPFLGHLKEQMGSPYRTRKTICMIGNPEKIHNVKAQEDEGDMDVGWDITSKDVERLRQILTPTIHTLPNLEPVVQPYIPLGLVHDKDKIVRKKE